MDVQYTKLLEYIRNGLAEQTHYGLVIYMNKKEVLYKAGNDNGYKFYHRSCMKPLQVSPLIDLEIDKEYNLTGEELAVCAASHTGDIIHQEKILSILNKIGFNENNLLCNPHLPLSKEEQKRLILLNLSPRKIHNNCSGKHSAMLAICQKQGFDIKNYKDYDHPLSKLVINKVCNLCESSEKDIIISKDGCGLPVIATTLEQLGKGFLNLFLNKKYERLKDAFLNNPYLIGGKGRLDSEIINISDNLIAKVGACGLCVVVNTDKEECIVVKIADSNMEARSFVTINALLQLKWLDPDKVFSSRMNKIYIKEILSQDNDILGEAVPCFSIS